MSVSLLAVDIDVPVAFKAPAAIVPAAIQEVMNPEALPFEVVRKAQRQAPPVNPIRQGGGEPTSNQPISKQEMEAAMGILCRDLKKLMASEASKTHNLLTRLCSQVDRMEKNLQTLETTVANLNQGLTVTKETIGKLTLAPAQPKTTRKSLYDI